MSDDQTYNGWTNYATWGCALVFSNDPYTQDRCEELTARALESDYPFVRLEDDLRDFASELARPDGFPDLPDMASQLLAAGMSEVNFREIAEHYIADYRAEHPDD